MGKLETTYENFGGKDITYFKKEFWKLYRNQMIFRACRLDIHILILFEKWEPVGLFKN